MSTVVKRKTEEKETEKRKLLVDIRPMINRAEEKAVDDAVKRIDEHLTKEQRELEEAKKSQTTKKLKPKEVEAIRKAAH